MHVASSQGSSSVPVTCYTFDFSLLSWKIMSNEDNSLHAIEGIKYVNYITWWSKTFKNLSSYWIWNVGRFFSVGIATLYTLDGPGIESRFWTRFSASVQIRYDPPPQLPVQSLPGLYGGGGKPAAEWRWYAYTFSVEVKNSRMLYVYLGIRVLLWGKLYLYLTEFGLKYFLYY